MGLIARNAKAWLTLFLIICNYRTTASRELPSRIDSLPSNGNGSRSISLSTSNLNNLLNKDPVQAIDKGVNKTGIVSSINAIKTDLDNLSQQFNIFTFIDIFINQSRQSIPLLVAKGNFTLLQAALLCAVGSMAAGAAIVVAEAFYFKKINEQEYYASQQQNGYYNNLPSLTYGHRSALERSDEDGAGVPKTRELHSPAGRGPSTMSPQKLTEYYERELTRMNKAQSLKRSQRRRQRKNKNWAGLANNVQMLSGGFRKAKRSVPLPVLSRTKRQASSLNLATNSQAFSDQQFRPNSFNQFLLSQDPEPRNDNTSNKSPQILPPLFSGPRAPQEPLPLPPQQQSQQFTEAPPPFLPPRPTPTSFSFGKFDFVSMFKNAMTAFLNYLFDHNGGYATNMGQLSRNDFMQQQQQQGQSQGQAQWPEFRFPKLKPNRGFIPHAAGK